MKLSGIRERPKFPCLSLSIKPRKKRSLIFLRPRILKKEVRAGGIYSFFSTNFLYFSFTKFCLSHIEHHFSLLLEDQGEQELIHSIYGRKVSDFVGRI